MTSGARLISFLPLEVKFNLTAKKDCVGTSWSSMKSIQGSWGGHGEGRRVAGESEESDKEWETP